MMKWWRRSGTATHAGAPLGAALVLFALASCAPARDQDVDHGAASAPGGGPSASPAAPVHPGFLYGRITTVDGADFRGRLRWGGDQEAFWSDYFNGTKNENPWVAHAPPERRSPSHGTIEVFGFTFGDRADPFRRLFMARFGEIARIDAHMRSVEVTLKSGTVVELDRFAAGDIDDGVRVWDRGVGPIDLDARRIRTIEFLPTPRAGADPARLYGTLRSRQGDFTGFIQWDQQDGVGSDVLDGRTAGGAVSLRYDTIRSIARRSRDTALVTRLDGRDLVLSGSRELSDGNRGIYVDDPRYGRVLVSWGAFERLDFGPGGSGPAYGDFPAGRPLAGRVITRDGRNPAGRLVYDFDESETTETLDVAVPGVDYNLPFGLIASIVPDGGDGRRPIVILRDGRELAVERSGDLGDRNAGLLIFAEGRSRPDYVPWADVERVDLDSAGR